MPLAKQGLKNSNSGAKPQSQDDFEDDFGNYFEQDPFFSEPPKTGSGLDKSQLIENILFAQDAHRDMVADFAFHRITPESCWESYFTQSSLRQLSVRELEDASSSLDEDLSFLQEQLDENERLEKAKLIFDRLSRHLNNMSADWERLNHIHYQEYIKNIKEYQDALEVLEIQHDYKPPTVIDIDNFQREFKEATLSPYYTKRLKVDMVLRPMGLSLESSSPIRSSIKKIAAKLLEIEVLVVMPEKGWRSDEYACLRVRSSNIYRIPAAASKLPIWKKAEQILAADPYDDSQIETMSVLYGGDAYKTLEEAAAAAVALEV